MKRSGHGTGNLVPRRSSDFIGDSCAPIGIHRQLIEVYCDAIRDGWESSTNGGNDFGKQASHILSSTSTIVVVHCNWIQRYINYDAILSEFCFYLIN